MRRQHNLALRAASSAALALVIIAVVAACGPDLVFRAYLGNTLWRPPFRSIDTDAANLPPERLDHAPYAGMSPVGGRTSLQAARDAYRALFPDRPDPFEPSLHWPEPVLANVRNLVDAARAENQADADELDLLRCKVDLRAASPDDRPALSSVRACFDSYLSRPRPEALASEARGWMARTDFLSGHEAAAAKFYLDELPSTTSNIRRERLLSSLTAIQPRLEDLDEYFDTPAHALFIADRITNDSDNDALEAALTARLEQHKELFGQGADSDALAVALMRAATRMGAPQMALRYAAQVRPGAPVQDNAEYNWLLGTARFEEKDYAAAATAFTKAISTKDASDEQRALAANGLVGAYAKLNRPLDHLWAAFELLSIGNNIAWEDGFESLDAAYLLDVQLTDAQLEQYLTRHASESPVVIDRRLAATFEKRPTAEPDARTSLDAVRYALAVRHARREEYDAAARLYDGLHSPRAATMRQAASLFAASRAANASSDAHLNALYDYASFLADHENGIFFNDTLWGGFQTSAFVHMSPDASRPEFGFSAANAAALTDDERARFERAERQLRDVQEEYWRAYGILNGIVQKAGPTPIGKKAAARAIVCLRRISRERFGRSNEIRAADIRLSGWLARNP
jgi:hypothetical protein